MPSIGDFCEDLFEVAQLAGRAANLELAFLGDDRDARGVVAAIFEFAQPLDDDGDDLFRADVADNSAHAAGLLTLEISLKSVAWSQELGRGR